MKKQKRSKVFTIYHVPDFRCPDGKMKKADGPAIRDAIASGKITPDETWDCDQWKLILRLKNKGVL